jgi:hypothetical protein
MAEELGKIEKPAAESFRLGRKLLYVPLLYGGEGFPEEYLQKTAVFWEQALKQVTDITARLGSIKRVYHELVAETGEAGVEAVKQVNPGGAPLVQAAVTQGAEVAALEDAMNLTEYMDWGRCLYIGLQNPDVQKKVIDAYRAAGEQRKKHMAEVIDTTLRQDEMGLLIVQENHGVSIPADIQLFYVAPPALDDIKRWLRDQEAAGEENAGAD